MARIAVVFGTTNGQTAKIARRIKSVLRAEGHLVDLIDTHDELPSTALTGVAAAVIAGSVRMGRFPPALLSFVQTHRDELLVMPTAFVPVSLSASRKSPAALREVQKTIRRFTAETGLNPNIIQPTAGALLYSRYGFFTKLAILFISRISGGDTDTSRDYEYTDWNAVDAFATRFADDVQQISRRAKGVPARARRAADGIFLEGEGARDDPSCLRFTPTVGRAPAGDRARGFGSPAA
jgi:menaquinone-dependent protoporphyrinogen oxidase